ncbi:MAG: GNAT family N-acetyltransferase [Chloroflexi bacterium]|nr:GNAT family N-acetyltransferase [Chloroflexota bacterium]
MTPSVRLANIVDNWLERRLGVPLSAAGTGALTVVPRPESGLASGAAADAGITVVRLNDRSLIVARLDWVEPLTHAVSDLHPDLLFTPFGSFELSRITLPDGVSVWGPNWYLMADSDSWPRLSDDRARAVTSVELAEVDFDLFWHCFGAGSLAAFGVFQEGNLVALSTVKDRGEPFMEIGVDVAPGAQSSGLGRAVVSAAGTWILEQGRLPLATVAPFNVPSTRTLRRVGLEYAFTEMSGVAGPFRMPPQPIGRPLPDAELYDYYPAWAMNRDIRPRSDLANQ